MSLDYVFGPVVATDTILNVNLQFHRVCDKQGPQYGWAWTADPELDGATSWQNSATGGDYEVDDHDAIESLVTALRDHLTEAVQEWREAHPKAKHGLQPNRA